MTTPERVTDEQLAKVLDYDRRTAGKIDESTPWLQWSILALQELQERRAADAGCPECKAKWELWHDQYCTQSQHRPGEFGGGLKQGTAS